MSAIPGVRAVSSGAAYLVTLTEGSGLTWLADEPTDAGGTGRAPTPHQLLLSSLGACTAITLRVYAARKGWPLQAVEVELQFNPDGAPGDGASDIRRRISLRGKLDAGQRERLLQIANRCPIHKVLAGEVRITSSLA
jgi:putative redox protein